MTPFHHEPVFSQPGLLLNSAHILPAQHQGSLLQHSNLPWHCQQQAQSSNESKIMGSYPSLLLLHDWLWWLASKKWHFVCKFVQQFNYYKPITKLMEIERLFSSNNCEKIEHMQHKHWCGTNLSQPLMDCSLISWKCFSYLPQQSLSSHDNSSHSFYNP